MILGDTHLGRQFRNNVPLHRLGEREKLMWTTFLSSLDPKGDRFHIHMGDLFDKDQVSQSIIMETARAYRAVAAKNPQCQFIILRGNHDASRDLEFVSSFEIFADLVSHTPNIHVVKESLVIDRWLFLGWHPVKTAAEVLAEAKLTGVEEAAFGHWDVDLRSDPFNLIPTKELAAAGITQAHTGHVHLAHDFERDGVAVKVVGSMLPLAFGEGGDLYVSISRDEALNNPDKYVNKCVRIELADDEVWDGDLDCLQLQVKKPDKVTIEVDVQFDVFDLDALFVEAFDEEDVPDDIRDECMKKWKSISSN